MVFDGFYRQWLMGICEQLEIPEIRILDEPTAAALGYGLTAGNETVLVIDFGGGTLDMSLVKLNFNAANPAQNRRQGFDFLLKWGDRLVNRLVNRSSSANSSSIHNSTAKVIAKTGQDLGGIDLDQWILEYFHETQNLPKNSLTTRLAEKLKIALSTSHQSIEVFFDDRTFDSYCLELDRSEFQNILAQHHFFTRLDRSLSQISQQIRQKSDRQNLELQSIDAVLLVGGTAQIPAVYDWVNQHFPADKIKFSQAFEAIAHGALSPYFQVQDFLYHSYGVRYWDKRHRQHNWHPIIAAGATYPTSPIELTLGASQPNQPSIEIVIGELGESNLEVYFEGNSLITRQLKSTQTLAQTLKQVIAPLHPLGQLGSDRLKVTFVVDAQRTLCITITDLLINQIILPSQSVVKLM
jgi:molecular chaperone DnaK (HSP70)